MAGHSAGLSENLRTGDSGSINLNIDLSMITRHELRRDIHESNMIGPKLGTKRCERSMKNATKR
jgi:hypothetical protein